MLNAVLGRKHVIVSPRPQTTRHRITGVLNGVATGETEAINDDELAEIDIQNVEVDDIGVDDVDVDVDDIENEDETDEEPIEVEELSEFDRAFFDDLGKTSPRDFIEDWDKFAPKKPEVKADDADIEYSKSDTNVLNSDFQIVFLDTPGIHEPQHKLGETLVKTAKGALRDIECVVFVADATDSPHDDDRRAAALLGGIKVPVLLALNKSDVGKISSTRTAEFQALHDFAATFQISALEETGLDELKAAIIERMPEGEPYFPPDMLSDRAPEFHIEERIREQAMLQLREEVPHSVAVGVEMMEPRKGGTLYIEAFIHVERDSQKRIVIGAGGARIKEIGQMARKEIETLLGRKVFLELRVKVRDKWRDNEMWISRLGYKDR